MNNDRVQTYRRIVSTMFNDGVINMGRVLVLFAFTSQMGQQYPTDAWKFWDIYHAVLKGTESRPWLFHLFDLACCGFQPVNDAEV
jgi:hypothetical protein